MDNLYSRVCPSLYRGIVESNLDPENLGRCKIRVPSVHGQLSYPVDILPWARPLVLSPIKKNRGSVNLPDVGDIVWVLFEGSDKEFPVYLGGTYATGDLEIDNDKVDFYIEDNTKISYNRKEKTYTIQIGENSILFSEECIKLIGDTTIKGSLSVSGDLSVEGNTTLNNLIIKGSCNKECDCP